MDSTPITKLSPPVPSIPEWDEPFTDQELEAIEATLRSATASTTKTRNASSFDSIYEDRKKPRRRLPQSIIATPTSSGFVSDRCGIGLDAGTRKRHRPRAILEMRYPSMKFGGSVIYSKTVTEVEKAATELLKIVEAKKREMGHAILGFDIEWRPTFRRGLSPGKAAVMQICGDTSHCYVMHIFHSGIPQNLQSLLEDPTSIKLQKFNAIRLGNWEADVLSKAQIQYAATDAFVSWYLYQMLKSLPDAADNKSEEQQGMLPQ